MAQSSFSAGDARWQAVNGCCDSCQMVLHVGDTVESFRHEVWTFEGITRGTDYNGTAKVLVSKQCSPVSVAECSHSWHRDNRDVREYYVTVFPNVRVEQV